MATTEHISLLSQFDESGNRKLIYPVTSTEAVDGLEEFIQEVAHDTTYDAATTIKDGLMTASMVTKLNGVAANATANTVSSFTVTLSSRSWSNLQQSVTASGVTTGNTVIVTPAPTSLDAYNECGVYCSAQSSNRLTFTCKEKPSSNLTVNVLILA